MKTSITWKVPNFKKLKNKPMLRRNLERRK